MKFDLSLITPLNYNVGKNNMPNILQALEKAYIKSTGGTKKLKTLTDVIPYGTTIFYGRSGAGKTYSIIKHLTKNKINPLMLDFDNNYKLDFDYYHIDGKWFYEQIKKAKALRDKPFNDVLKFMKNNKKRVGGEVIHDDKLYENYTRYENEVLPFLSDELKEEYNSLFDAYATQEPPTKKLRNKTIIIDTYAMALQVLKNGFNELIKHLKEQDCNIIIISHETGERGKDTEVDEIFANHADGRLRLHRDITKTKQDTYLVIEKKRGHQGDNILFDWER